MANTTAVYARIDTCPVGYFPFRCYSNAVQPDHSGTRYAL